MANQQPNDGKNSADQPKLRHFRLRNRLKEKASGGSGGGGGKVSEELMELAAAEFSKMSEDYPDWVAGYLESLYKAHRGAAEVAPDLRAKLFREINAIAHEMKGQGGTFGYPLITTFGKSLYDFTEGAAKRDNNHLEIVKAHIDAMKAVIAGRIEGDGGTVGNELREALRMAIDKHLHKRSLGGRK